MASPFKDGGASKDKIDQSRAEIDIRSQGLIYLGEANLTANNTIML